MRGIPHTSVVLRLVLIVALAALGACTDDDGEGASASTSSVPISTPTTPVTRPAAVIAYCDAAEALEQSPEGPTLDLVQRAVAAAPAEIASEATTVGQILGATLGDLGDALADGTFRAASNALEVWEAANCGPEQAEPRLIEAAGEEAAAPGAAVVEVGAVDFAFDLPDEIPAGPTALRVTNRGEDGHEAFVAAVAPEVTLEQLLEFEGDPFASGLLTAEIGGVFLPVPGDVRVVNADLAPGDHVIVCFIPGPGGTPHAFLGMAERFRVV